MKQSADCEKLHSHFVEYSPFRGRCDIGIVSSAPRLSPGGYASWFATNAEFYTKYLILLTIQRKRQSQKLPSPGAARHPLPEGEGLFPSPSGRGAGVRESFNFPVKAD